MNAAANDKQVILVTGTSTGLGHLTALTLARRGHCVYAGMRNPEDRNRLASKELGENAAREALNLHVVDLDVTDEQAIERVINAIIARQARIDVVVNNAGVMYVAVTEALTTQQIEHQMDVNFLGAVRLDRAVIPQMRKQGGGLLVHVSSLAGRLVFPFFGAYCASKYALEAMAESYRYELSGQGIDSVIIEPGPFPTAIIENVPEAADQQRLRDYGDVADIPRKMLDSFDAFLRGETAPDPRQVADDIALVVETSQGQRPARVVSGLDYGVRQLNAAVRPFQNGLLDALGLLDLDPESAA
jgi:NAD(P)-dependent dehydrogenase (short-subunit alcohol dehydrogenase family)